jgi:hypothetical protein
MVWAAGRGAVVSDSLGHEDAYSGVRPVIDVPVLLKTPLKNRNTPRKTPTNKKLTFCSSITCRDIVKKK